MSLHQYLAYALTCILVLSYVLTRSYTALFGPLGKIPGPRIARWTHLRLKLAVLMGKRMYYVHNLHQKYGPIVRISPWELSVSDPTTAKDIHRAQSGFLKSEWYQSFTGESETGIFAMTDSKDHAQRRKIFAQTLSASFLKNIEAPVRKKVQLAVSRIDEEMRSKGSADILKWWTLMATDIIGELSFGTSFCMLEQGKKNGYIHDLETLMRVNGVRSELPFLVLLSSILPVGPFKKDITSRERMHLYGRESIARYKRSLAAAPKQAMLTFFTKMLESNQLSDFTVENEALNFIVAGSDTTANTATYMIWAVLSHPEVRGKVIEEVRKLPHDYNGNNVLTQTHYMNWVVEESLRLYGAAPGGLPRVVPSGGRDLLGHFVPPGTIVSTQSYTIHRDETVFHDPMRFIPERWEQPTKAMKEAFHPFGSGSRICLGINLAYMELRLALVIFFRELPSVAVAPQTTPATMEMQNYFLISPIGHECLVEHV